MIAQAVRVHRLIQADKQRLVDENTHLRQELKERYDFSNLIGTSGPMRQVYEQIAQVARTNTTVLLRGESGTGKELIAHAIHYNSPRAKKPFVKVSCAALPHDLIESELFGYEKGAFTGAHGTKKGRFEVAEGGTLFLDEIGELNLGDAGQAAARAAGARVRAPRRHRDDSRQHPPDRGDQQGSREGDCGRRVPRGPLLPPRTCSRSSCRRCASGSRTCCCWPTTSSRSSRASTASR